MWNMLCRAQVCQIQMKNYKYMKNHDYIKPKYGKMTKLYYMDMDSFIFHLKLEDIYPDLDGGFKKRFDTSNYQVRRSPPIGKNKKDLVDER